MVEEGIAALGGGTGVMWVIRSAVDRCWAIRTVLVRLSDLGRSGVIREICSARRAGVWPDRGRFRGTAW